MKQKLILWLAVILLLVAVGFMVKDFFYQPKSNQDNPYEYSLDKLREINDSLICYKELGSINIDFDQPHCITIDKKDILFIGGQGFLLIYDSDLKETATIKTDKEIRCLAVDNNDIYLGVNDHLEKWDLKGNVLQVWDTINKTSYLTSIAVSETSVFVADAGNKIVFHYDKNGVLLNKIGEKNKDKGILGFVIPSPYFDLLIGRVGELVVVNPGRHSFESYNENGDLITSWTRSSMTIDGFSGCCNPSNIAMLSDGSFVTSEKGLERVKTHLPNGDFKCVVAPPRLFKEGTKGIDLAVDSQDRIYVLDPVKKLIRIFETKL